MATWSQRTTREQKINARRWALRAAAVAFVLTLASAAWSVQLLRTEGPGEPFGVSAFGFQVLLTVAWGAMTIVNIAQAARMRRLLNEEKQ